MTIESIFTLILLGLIFLLILASFVQFRASAGDNERLVSTINVELQRLRDTQSALSSQMESAMVKDREERARNAKDLREELVASIYRTHESGQQALLGAMEKLGTMQGEQLTRFSEQILVLQKSLHEQSGDFRRETLEGHRHFADQQHLKMTQFAEALQVQSAGLQELGEKLRLSLEQKIALLQHDNAEKLELMRQTVDEKLQGTLEKRLGESFKQVSDRLEAVHQGLGDMQNLAKGVGDLKNVLTNVKTRGIWGEFQLGNLLQEMLTPDQYAENVAVKPGSNDRVEFAIRLPGQQESQAGATRGVYADSVSCVWLPIDAKFPREDYDRLIAAMDTNDSEGMEIASKALDARIRTQAKSIHDKYLAPPFTTDFAMMFLPTEGLYAEVLRRPGVFEGVQRDYRVVIAGPSTLCALINALQMGFRTLAIAKQSSEVWRTLGEVKSQFSKFGGVLDKVKKQMETASNSIDLATQASRSLERRLRQVEMIPINATNESMEMKALLGNEINFSHELPGREVTDHDLPTPTTPSL
jgi:DNA recombination protein RmuC